MSLSVGAGLLGLLAVGLIAFSYADVRNAGASRASDIPVDLKQGLSLREPVAERAKAFLNESVTLKLGSESVTRKWSELGMRVDQDLVEREAARLVQAGVTADGLDVGGAGRRIPVALDRKTALDALLDVKTAVDQAPTDARLELEERKVIEEQPGFGVDVYASLARVEAAGERGAKVVELAGAALPPRITRAELGIDDISNVLGHFETQYATNDSDRNYNLMVAAEKIHGHVIPPGETFSFNGVVGNRTELEGYRIAHVITGGEMVDGLAGGACQISSTLHGAAWFAGLDLVEGVPHSRPSAYITMGMDATVSWPHLDVKLRNPYEFPIVLKYVLSRGTVRVEVLGRQRPWDKISFVREVVEEIPYETVTREDDSMPVGSTVVEQIGFPGYKLKRFRLFYKDGSVAKKNKWDVTYPPTTEYMRIGTNPDPNMAAPKQGKQKGLKPQKATYVLDQ